MLIFILKSPHSVCTMKLVSSEFKNEETIARTDEETTDKVWEDTDTRYLEQLPESKMVNNTEDDDSVDYRR